MTVCCHLATAVGVGTIVRGKARPWTWGILALGLLGAAGLNLMAGSLSIGPVQMIAILLRPLLDLGDVGAHTSAEAAVVWNLRLPRVLGGMLVGAALASAGAATQGLFRNPLADPALIGVTSGGALGALFGILGIGMLPHPSTFAQSIRRPGRCADRSHLRSPAHLPTGDVTRAHFSDNAPSRGGCDQCAHRGRHWLGHLRIGELGGPP